MRNLYISCFFFVASLTLTKAALPWLNEYDQKLVFDCPAGQVLMYISSIHNNDYEDRIWEMYCRSVSSSTSNCEKSDYVNDFDGPVSFSCPNDKVLTGIESYHIDMYEDRRFKYTCCTGSSRPLSNCYYTDFTNEVDEKETLFVPEGQAIASVYSYHDNSREDRRFRYELCSL